MGRATAMEFRASIFGLKLSGSGVVCLAEGGTLVGRFLNASVFYDDNYWVT